MLVLVGEGILGRVVVLPVLGVEESLEEHVAEGVLGIFGNPSIGILVGTYFLALLLEFVDGDLANQHGEIVLPFIVQAVVHCDMGLWGKLEFFVCFVDFVIHLVG